MKVTAKSGEVHVTASEITYECHTCRARLVYDSVLPAHRRNHQREGGACAGALLEICPGCQKPEPNVGPWRDAKCPHTRLCGGCKLRAWATPANIQKLEAELQAAAKTVFK